MTGFFDVPEGMRRFAEDERRLKDQLAQFTQLLAADRAAQSFPDCFGVKTDKDALRRFEQMCASLARPSTPFEIASQYEPWTPPALPPESFEYGQAGLQRAIDKAVERALAKRDPKPVEVDPELYGRDGVRRQPGFKAGDDEDDEK